MILNERLNLVTLSACIGFQVMRAMTGETEEIGSRAGERKTGNDGNHRHVLPKWFDRRYMERHEEGRYSIGLRSQGTSTMT